MVTYKQILVIIELLLQLKTGLCCWLVLCVVTYQVQTDVTTTVMQRHTYNSLISLVLWLFDALASQAELYNHIK